MIITWQMFYLRKKVMKNEAKSAHFLHKNIDMFENIGDNNRTLYHAIEKSKTG
jgi:hypothetical protein